METAAVAGLQHAMSVEGSEVYACKPQDTILEFPNLCLVDMAEQHLVVQLEIKTDAADNKVLSATSVFGSGWAPALLMPLACVC